MTCPSSISRPLLATAGVGFSATRAVHRDRRRDPHRARSRADRPPARLTGYRRLARMPRNPAQVSESHGVLFRRHAQEGHDAGSRRSSSHSVSASPSSLRPLPTLGPFRISGEAARSWSGLSVLARASFPAPSLLRAGARGIGRVRSRSRPRHALGVPPEPRRQGIRHEIRRRHGAPVRRPPRSSLSPPVSMSPLWLLTVRAPARRPPRVRAAAAPHHGAGVRRRDDP
jgi:hypothetical protein